MIVPRQLKTESVSTIECDLNLDCYVWAQPLDDERTYVKMSDGPDVVVMLPFKEFLAQKQKENR